MRNLEKCENNVELRMLRQEDWNFISSCFLKSMRRCEAFKNVNSFQFYKLMQQKLEQAILDYDVVVACDPQNTNIVYGYLIARRGEDPNCIELFHGFVKYPFRKMSIGSYMVKSISSAVNIEYAFETFAMKRLKKKGYFNFIHNPLLG